MTQALSASGGLWTALALVPNTIALLWIALIAGAHGAILAHILLRK
jgi:hypothetical protein